MTMKVLVIEDEFEIQEGLKNFLEDAGYSVDVASDGLEGAYKSQQEKYDLILLDIMLPKMDGYAVLEMIRKESDVPVLMLTAMGTEESQIKGFDLKVDDYIVKPFTMSIVLKRMEAVLRRCANIKQKNVQQSLTYEEITINLNSCEVVVSNKKISLTDKEYELLKLLLKHPNQLFTRENLLNKLWGYDFFGNDYLVNVHIGNLRKKIGAEYIQTIRGKGYKLVNESKE